MPALDLPLAELRTYRGRNPRPADFDAYWDAALRELAVETREARALVDEYTLADGRRLYLIGDGRLVNLAAAEGHPAIVMDMSFANQALAAEWVVANGAGLERRVYDVPKDIDEEIARLKLATMGVAIDTLTDEQQKYLDSWNEGTE